jgi:hypothetical protein
MLLLLLLLLPSFILYRFCRVNAGVDASAAVMQARPRVC